MYSLPTEIKDKTQVKQFGQVPLKIDQALFLCIFHWEEAGNFRKLQSHGQNSKKNIQYDTENFFQGSWETHFNSVNSYHITTRLERFF